MPEFSQQSKDRLATCHADLQTLFNEVIKYVDCTVTCGFRNAIDQNIAFTSGNSDKRFPFGKHNQNPSLAVDVYFYPVEMKNTKKFYWFAGYVLSTAHQLKAKDAIKHDIRCGIDWDGDHDFDDQKLNDLVHFEIIQ